jgi:hypothetical protein
MATTNQPFGLLARWHPSGQARSNQYVNVLLSGMTTPIYYGTPVKLVIGAGSAISGVTVPTGQMVLQPVAATTDSFIGSFAGVEYVDVNGRGQFSKFWSASLTLQTGTQAICYVWDDPENVYEIAFDGALNTGTNVYQFYGKQATFNSTDLGSGTAPAGNATPIGQSSQRANATLTATGSQGQLIIVSSFGPASSTTQIGDAYPTQYVKVLKHQYRAAVVSL